MTDVPVVEAATPVNEVQKTDGPRSTDPRDTEAQATPEAVAGKGSDKEVVELVEVVTEVKPDSPEGRKPRKTMQDRFDELTAEKYAKQAAIEERDRKIADLESKLSASPPAVDNGVVKKIQDFDFDQDAYLRYLAKHEAQNIVESQKAHERQQAEEVKQLERNKKFQYRQATFSVDRLDSREVIFKNPLAEYYPKDMQEYLIESDVGPQLAYHLGQNLNVTDALIRMEPRSRDRALAKLEASLEAKPAAATPRTFTQAPAPVKSLAGSGQVEKSIDDMTMPEYVAWRKRQTSAKR
jgi:signal recognition particle GTPase